MPEGAVARMIAQTTVMGRLDTQRQALESAQLDLAMLIHEARRLGLAWGSISEAVGIDRETLRRRYGADSATR